MTKALSGIAELLVKGGSSTSKAQEVLEAYAKKNKTKDDLKNISDEDLSLEDIKKKYKVNQKQKRIPEVQIAAQKLYISF